MDAKINEPVLQAELAALEQALDESKTADVIRLERALGDARKRRGRVSTAHDKLCESLRTEADTAGSNARPNAELRELAKQLKAADDEVGLLRGQLTRARLAWGSPFFRAIRPHLDGITPALEHAAAIVEAAAEIHEVFDRFVAQNGLGYWTGGRSIAFANLARQLRLHLKDMRNEK